MSKVEKFSDLWKLPWIKSSIKIGVILLVIGLTIIFYLKFFNTAKLITNVETFVKEFGLIGVLFATILAGTIIPLGSPALVVAAALLGVPLAQLILVATSGFTIGMVLNYALAYHLGRSYIMKKISRKKFDEITFFWFKWGWFIYVVFGLIPFLPVEVLSLICGLFKMRIDLFLVLSFTPRLIVFTLLAYFGNIAGNWIGIT
jgi:membrane protein YqaA with SNARE-associated domain